MLHPILTSCWGPSLEKGEQQTRDAATSVSNQGLAQSSVAGVNASFATDSNGSIRSSYNKRNKWKNKTNKREGKI